MTATRSPLTSTTWATLAANHAYLSRDYAQAQATRLCWADTADLAAELAERHPHLAGTGAYPGLTGPARVIVDLCVSQTPVILTWTSRLGHDGGSALETTTDAVIIEYVGTEQAYIRYCGFGHWVQLSAVVAAQTFAEFNGGTRTYS